jgi:hypothetical protein
MTRVLLILLAIAAVTYGAVFLYQNSDQASPPAVGANPQGVPQQPPAR